ncbi:DUF488 domain-containing protein [Aneurinibacillus aneurinilyticus]|uniref:DUF488 domain-containing protein n=1 Tax=Aneurinibacillus aneurinilyticus TaxID=1391 RepID=UPI002E1EEE3D|nr:DUF488 domain-containing protein [Aneurinibacillus aneurinilyticus]
MQLFTTGYEGETIDQWISKLKLAGVTVLVDIRERALSRKKGFSKTALKEHLEGNNIRYIHLKNLGSPSEIRKQLMESKDYPTFFEKYNEYLENQKDTLELLVHELKEEKPCLMCFEKNHRQCHRHAVVKRLEEIYPEKVRVEHL